MALITPDPERCQVEKGGAFTLGPGLVRCDGKAVFILEESRPGPDGQIGAQSICQHCYDRYQSRCAEEGYVITPVDQWLAERDAPRLTITITARLKGPVARDGSVELAIHERVDEALASFMPETTGAINVDVSFNAPKTRK